MANNPPLSFKTVPGRNRTQKWSQAKTYNYDGDDWGGYDPYDEYGSYDDDPAGPAQPPQHAHGRQNSFDRGVENETRAFSAGYAREPSPQKEVSDRPSTNDGRTRARDFSNPGQVPQPLQMRSSPAAAERPPRKSSLSSASAKSGEGVGSGGGAATTAAPPTNTDKPLPFIRPSDIYKRMAEEKERERQSMESSRPSMDSVQRASESPSRGPGGKRSMESLPSSSGRRPSLEPVSEGRERMQSPLAPVSERPGSGEKSFDGFKVDSPELAKALGAGVAKPEETHSPVSPVSPVETRQGLQRDDSGPQLPPMGRLSGFGSLGTGLLPSDREASEEPASTHAPAGSDPAADILAERQQDPHVEAVGRAPHEDATGLSGPPRTYDPASEISSERQQEAPASRLGRVENEDPAGLSHQPSSGFRSVVHTAFDRQDDDSVPPTPVSRDNSQNQGSTGAGVGRSDTNSTASISPIMSRVPSAATAQQRQQERTAAVPPIAEESETSRSRPASGTHGAPVSRKPVHSRNVSAEIPGFEPGHRRDLNTPSPNNSPARTPGMEDTSSRRLSGPMAAQTVSSGAEAPDVSPVAPEAPAPTLHPVDTSVSNATTPADEEPPSHAGDYTTREADLADTTNSTPDKGEGSPDVAHAATLSQNAFLRSHPDLPAPSSSNPTSPSSPGTAFAKSPQGFGPRSTTPGSGRTSPMAGGGGGNGGNKRVRHIVDQYHQIDDEARRHSTASSKSSWSNFGNSQENLTLKRRGTGGHESDAPTSVPGSPERQRPEPAGRLESFRPHLPGEWVSYAATPAGERPPGQVAQGMPKGESEVEPASPPTPRPAELQRADSGDVPDLTPTTQKTQLRGSDPNADEGDGALGALKSAGDALAASLSGHAGYGHQTQDFAAPKEATPPPVDVPEMRPRQQTGDVYANNNVPVLMRGDSEMTTATEGTEWSGEGSVVGSKASEVPPTPPAKDTGYGLNPPQQGGGEDRPVSGYFSGVQGDEMAPPAPLKVSRSSQAPGIDANDAARPAMLPTMSTDTGVGDSESDRLRKDIVRTLSPDKKDEMARHSILEQEDVEREQDALDAPTNERRLEQGKDALPAAETGRSGLPSQMSPPASTANRPAFLTERFSWEKAPQGTGLYAPGTRAVGEDGDDADRRSYERPRSSQGLHIMNPGEGSEVSSKVQTPAREIEEPAAAERGMEESTLPAGTGAMARESGLEGVAPEPLGEGEDDGQRASHIPSYYGGAALSSPSTLVDPPSPPSPPPATEPATTAGSAAQPPVATSSRILPFREILTIKSTPERIKAYGSTRDTFATMDTGLPDWNRNMVSRNPEYANLSTATAPSTGGLPHTGTGLGTLGRGHKHTPSVFNKLPKLGSSTSNNPDSPAVPSGGGQRVTSAGSSGPGAAGGAGQGGVDVERMQARGKDFIKGVGGGAKGLFAKGKSRFGRGGGGEKAPHPLPRSSLFAIESSFQSTPDVASGNPTTVPPTSTNGVRDIPRDIPAQGVEKGKGKVEEGGPPSLAPLADVGGLATQEPLATGSAGQTDLGVTRVGGQKGADEQVPTTDTSTTDPHPSTADKPAANAPAAEVLAAMQAAPDSPVQESRPSPRQRPSFFSRLRSASRSLASRSRPGSVVLSPWTASQIGLGGGEAAGSKTGTSTPATPRARSRSRSRSLSRVRDHLRSRSRAASTSDPTDDFGQIAGARRSGEALVPTHAVPAPDGEVRRRSEERSRSHSRGSSRRASRSLSLGRVSGGLIPGVTGGVPALPTPSVALAAKENFLGGAAGDGKRKEAWEEVSLHSPAGQRREAWEDAPPPTASGTERRGEAREDGRSSPKKDEEQARRLGVLPSPATDAGFAPLSPERKSRERGQSVGDETVPERRNEEYLEERRSEDKDGVRTRPGTPPAFVALQRAEEGEKGDGAAHAEQPIVAGDEGEREVAQPTPVRPEDVSHAPRAFNENPSMMAVNDRQAPAVENNAATVEPTAVPAASAEAPPREDSPPPSQPASFAKPQTVPTTPSRPPNQRKPSALAELPSQQRNRQLSQPASAVASPSESPLASPRRAHATPVKYSGIPTPAMVMAGLKDRVAKEQQAGAVTEDDVFATPLTPSGDATVAGTGSNTPARVVSRPVSAEGHRKSVVSARDDKSHEGKKAGDAASRMSSVSSLGSPGSHDTVVATPGASKRQSRVMTPGSQAEAFMPGGFESSAPISPSRAASMGSSAVLQSASAPGSSAQRPPNQRSLSSQSLTQEQCFARRSYIQPQDDRPMSYMPLARDSGGVPMQEMLDREQGGHSRRPSGARTPSFSQYPSRQNSMVRQPSLGSPPSEYDRLRSPQPEDSRPGTGTDRRSKRLSGFFRGSQPTSITPDTGNTILPPPSQIHENYNGLEDPEVSQLTDELATVEKSDKQSKRRSGIWNTFKRTPSESLSNLSRANSSYGMPGQAISSPRPAPAPTAAPKEDNRPKTLKKLNRATSSAATGEEPKKKRFSRLGSIFGRSNTSATKTNRLSKAPPPAQQNAQAYGSAPTGGARGGYEAYEAARRRQMPPPQYWQQGYGQQQAPYMSQQGYGQPQQYMPQQPYAQQQPYVQPQQEEVEVMMSSPYREEPPPAAAAAASGSPHQRSPSWSHSRHSSFSGPPGGYQQQPPSQPHSRRSSFVGLPQAYGSPPAEYYAPQAPQSPTSYGPGSPQAMTSPHGSAASPQTRRLHSASYQRQDALPFTPQTYGAVGPFNNHQPASPPPQAPTGLVYENAPTGRPVPSAYPRPAPRSRQSSYNNGQQHTAPDAYFHQRQASYSSQDEYPHAPLAQTYQPQPQPMYYQPPPQHLQSQQQRARPAVAPVQTSGQDSGSRASSMGSINQLMAKSPAREYADQQTPYGIAVPGGDPRAAAWGSPPPPQQQQQQRQGPPRAALGAVVQPQQYQTPPPQGYGQGPPAQYAPLPQQRARYYDQLGQQQQQQQQHHHQRQHSGEGRPLTFQRTPSGFTGRRDDAALGEAELMGLGMRGASYPGQEWVPGPGSRF